MKSFRNLFKTTGALPVVAVIAAVVLAVTATYNFAPQYTQLASVAGTVQIMRHGSNEWTAASAGTVLPPGTSVRTGDASGAKVSLGKSGVLFVSHNSELSIKPGVPEAAATGTARTGFNNQAADEALFGETPAPAGKSREPLPVKRVSYFGIRLEKGEVKAEISPSIFLVKRRTFFIETPDGYAITKNGEILARAIPLAGGLQGTTISEFFALRRGINIFTSGAKGFLPQGKATTISIFREGLTADGFETGRIRASLELWTRQLRYRKSTDKLTASGGGGCPEGMALVPAGNIVSFPENMPWDPVIRFVGGFCIDIYEYPNEKEAMPVVLAGYEAHEQASELCRGEGKRLCSSQEWQRACGGSRLNIHPYGDEYLSGKCNAGGAGSARSGDFPGCINDFGLYDMAGNLWEITSTGISNKVSIRIPPDENQLWQTKIPVDDISLKVVRGGSWLTEPAKANCRFDNAYDTYELGFINIGFRCCY